MLRPPNSTDEEGILESDQHSFNVTLRFLSFFFLLDRLLDHGQAPFLAAAGRAFDIDQLEVQLPVESKARLNVLKPRNPNRLSRLSTRRILRATESAA